MRSVARTHHVSLCTVQRWMQHAGTRRLDRIDWSARSHATKTPRHISEELERLVIAMRHELRTTSDLGDYGAAEIHRTLCERGAPEVPAIRTIHRILERRGALDGQRRIRRPAPPPGWYLPDVAAGRAELDSFDFIDGLVLQGGPHLEILTGILCRSLIAVGASGRARRQPRKRCMPTGGGFEVIVDNACCGSAASGWNGPTRISTRPGACAGYICAAITISSNACSCTSMASTSGCSCGS